MVKLAAFWRGGKSQKLARNSATSPAAARTMKALSNCQSY